MLKGIKILVAEDNLINQKIVNYVLSKQGAIVENARDGREAINALEKGHFDLVLMDLQMPEMNGFETAVHIRTVMKLDLPIVALTADLFANEADKCKEVGIDTCIIKPFSPDHLLQVIETMVSERASGSVQEKTPIVDFAFIYDMAGGDSKYVHDVVELYLHTFPEKLDQLEQQIQDTDDFDAIEKQAHFLKSGSSVIKVRDMFEDLKAIEYLAKQKTGKPEIVQRMGNILSNFRQAMPVLVAEKEKAAVAKG